MPPPLYGQYPPVMMGNSNVGSGAIPSLMEGRGMPGVGGVGSIAPPPPPPPPPPLHGHGHGHGHGYPVPFHGSAVPVQVQVQVNQGSVPPPPPPPPPSHHHHHHQQQQQQPARETVVVDGVVWTKFKDASGKVFFNDGKVSTYANPAEDSSGSRKRKREVDKRRAVEIIKAQAKELYKTATNEERIKAFKAMLEQSEVPGSMK